MGKNGKWSSRNTTASRCLASGNAAKRGARPCINSAATAAGPMAGAVRIFRKEVQQQQQQGSCKRRRDSAPQPAGRNGSQFKQSHAGNARVAAEDSAPHLKRQRLASIQSSGLDAACLGQRGDLRPLVEESKSKRRQSQEDEQPVRQQHNQRHRKSATEIPITGVDSPGSLQQQKQKPVSPRSQTVDGTALLEVKHATDAVPKQAATATADSVSAGTRQLGQVVSERISTEQGARPARSLQKALAVAAAIHSNPEPAVIGCNSAGSHEESVTGFEAARACGPAADASHVGEERVSGGVNIEQQYVDQAQGASKPGAATADCNREEEPFVGKRRSRRTAMAAAALPSAAPPGIAAAPAAPPAPAEVVVPEAAAAAAAAEQQGAVSTPVRYDEDSDGDEHAGGIVFKRNSPSKSQRNQLGGTAQQQQHQRKCPSVYRKRNTDPVGVDSRKRLSSSSGGQAKKLAQLQEVSPEQQQQRDQASHRQQEGTAAKQQPVAKQQGPHAQAAESNKASSTGSAGSCRATAAVVTATAAVVTATAAAVGSPQRQRASSAAPGAGDDGDSMNLAAAVAAAGIPLLPAAMAVLRSGAGDVSVDPQQYHVGDKIPGRRGAKLFIQNAGTGDWEQRSKSCHDCQEQHIHYKCKEKGCKGASVCNMCLVNRYHGLHSLADLHTRCPVCRGECTCRACLRKADPAQLLPPPIYDQQQRHGFGASTLKVLGPLLATFLDQQDTEAQAWGYSGGVISVPRKGLQPEERLLCDRCATQVVGLMAHCDQCGWDCCSTCAAELRKHIQQNTTAAAALPVTCCNPGCPSVAGKPSHAVSEHIARGGLLSQRGATELSAEVLMPRDLVKKLEQLQQLAQDYGAPRGLELSDCPLLPVGAAADLLGPNGAPLTLAQLQAANWWTYLPQHLQDPWRRRVTSSSWMFTPHIRDLTGAADIPQDAQPAGWGPKPQWQQQQAHLALALYWARWQLGEPIVVRGATGRLKWDPATLRRAVRDIKAERASRKQKPQNSSGRGKQKKASGRGAASPEPDVSGGDSNSSHEGSDDEGPRVRVMDCQDFSLTDITEHEFFVGYKHGYCVERRDASGVVYSEPKMLKVRDWPPRSHIKENMARHYVDFLAALPVREYTDPRLEHSLLNLASALREADTPTDLGPKCYVAYGRVAEAQGEGDSVTKLHVDMADAVNLLLHTEPGADAHAQAAAAEAAARNGAVRCGDAPANQPSYDGAGAVWDICPRGAATKQLSTFLTQNAHDFVHQGETVSAADDPMVDLNPIFTQKFMLVERHRQQLAAQQGLELWHFEQHRGEAVFIPGGCPHQVRNLQSCSKIAVDFVSPESMFEALGNREQLRTSDLAIEQELELNPEDRPFQEKLQSQLMLVRGVLRAAELAGAGNSTTAAAKGGAKGGAANRKGRK